MEAWFLGAFDLCLELCDAIRPPDAESRTHVALLTARALMRLNELERALRVLRDAASIPCGTDESLALRMLIGAAHVRSGDLAAGLEQLHGVRRDAGAAHRTIRSEISLNIAQAHYGLHDLEAADHALNTVRSDADIVYARSLEVRGWVAAARGQSERATTAFIAALTALDGCLHRDRFLEANCIRALAHQAVERLDRHLWSIVSERRGRIDWSASGLAQARFWIAYNASAYAADVDGDLAEAAREARVAEQVAPSTSCRVQARCKRAAVARIAGEAVSQRDHTDSAAELLAEVDSAQITGDNAIVLLLLAEGLTASRRVGEARSLVDRYISFSRPNAMLSVTHAPTTLGFQRFVEANVLEASGDRDAALGSYRDVFKIYSRIGYTRRAGMAALRIATVTGDAKMQSYVTVATRQLSPRSWMRRETDALAARSARLTGVQREVLALICQGKSNPEIARLRNRSLHTVRNLVARLFEIFEVKSREELAVECVRRGIYTRA